MTEPTTETQAPATPEPYRYRARLFEGSDEAFVSAGVDLKTCEFPWVEFRLFDGFGDDALAGVSVGNRAEYDEARLMLTRIIEAATGARDALDGMWQPEGPRDE